MTIVRFGLLGVVEAHLGAEPIALGHARQRWVLAVLLADANRPVPVDRLTERIWGEQPPYRARRLLASYVSRLRRILAGDGRTHRGGRLRPLVRRAAAGDQHRRQPGRGQPPVPARGAGPGAGRHVGAPRRIGRRRPVHQRPGGVLLVIPGARRRGGAGVPAVRRRPQSRTSA